jgi:DNA replication initiation complex subunit (GINS family)
MITYSDLYELLRKEKYNEQLQLLPPTFMNELAEYFEDKKKIANKDSEDFSDTILKTKKQLTEAVIIFKELITRRQRKIINLALIAAKTGINKRDAENMTDNEQKLFETIVSEIEKESKNIDNIINGVREEKNLKNQLVRFKQDIPAFLDADEQPIGPFKAGEMANLPKKIADILVKNTQAEYLDDET